MKKARLRFWTAYSRIECLTLERYPLRLNLNDTLMRKLLAINIDFRLSNIFLCLLSSLLSLASTRQTLIFIHMIAIIRRNQPNQSEYAIFIQFFQHPLLFLNNKVKICTSVMV
jgi:hypothetical protein